MKRYLAFYWNNYYPGGGMNDFIGNFDNFEDAKKAIHKVHSENLPGDLEWSWASGSVYDSLKMKQVYSMDYEEIIRKKISK